MARLIAADHIFAIEAIEVFSELFGQVIVPLLVGFNCVFELLPAFGDETLHIPFEKECIGYEAEYSQR